ncbi:MAG: hypothetical protein DRJ60_00460 [Thermoprotei archaeon]|nr:MAG: hypothetical protein DRJ60_00460 [Thermoprotei archaeon]
MVRCCIYCALRRSCRKYEEMKRSAYEVVNDLAKKHNEKFANYRHVFIKKLWIDAKRLANKCSFFMPIEKKA